MNFPLKLRFLTLLITVIFILIFGKLFYWQVISYDKLASQADKQHFSSQILPAVRGEILASDHSPLVTNKETYLLYAHLPELPANKLDLAGKLAGILSVGVPYVSSESSQISSADLETFQQSTKSTLQGKILDKIASTSALWVNLAHFVSSPTKNTIESLKIPGLGFTPETTRDYPEASMAAHLLGFVGSDNLGSPKGFFGLEGYFDRELAGRAGEIRTERDAFGQPIAIGEETKTAKQDGGNLITSLDRSVQHFVETDLKTGIKDWKASGGTVVVIEPDTGRIIALASFPTYDPRDFSYYATNLYKNPAVADLYEPGSIFKPLVVSAALNEGKITPQTRCDRCTGPVPIGGFLIHTFNNQYHPNLDMTEVLINSDNTGMVFVGSKLGFTDFYSYLSRYGFAQKTNVDLQEEEGGSLRKIGDYYPIDQATLAFGQGINVTAMQMVRAWSTLANGGLLITPHLVTDIEKDGVKINVEPKSKVRVLKTETTKIITQMLTRVARESPTHFPLDRIADLRQFNIAAKSGTAQIALGGKYKDVGTIASVIGFFPADKPRFLIYVKLNEPEVRPWGSDTAGPVFFAIIHDLVNYYSLAP